MVAMATMALVLRAWTVDEILCILIQQDNKRAFKLLGVTHHVVELVEACSGKQETRPVRHHSHASIESVSVSLE